MRALLSLLIAMFSIQSGASIAKNLFPILGAPGTTALRIGFAAFLLGFLWRPWKTKWSHENFRNVCFYGIALGVMNLTFYLALARIPLGLTVTLEFLGPLVVSVFASRRKMDWLWAVLAFIGVLLILPHNENTSSDSLDLWGVGLALVAGACWGCYIIFGQKLSRSVSGGVAASTGMIIAALVSLPFGIYFSHSKIFAVELWPMAFLVALLSSAIPYSLEMIALKALPTSTFGILMSLEPAVAALAGYFFLHETLKPIQIFAMICIIVASMGSARASSSQSSPKSADTDSSDN